MGLINRGNEPGDVSAEAVEVSGVSPNFVTTKLSAQKWFAGSNRHRSASSRRSLSYQVNNSTVECAVRLGGTHLNIEDFLALKPGDVIRLDQKTENDLNLLIGNVPKFEGKPLSPSCHERPPSRLR